MIDAPIHKHRRGYIFKSFNRKPLPGGDFIRSSQVIEKTTSERFIKKFNVSEHSANKLLQILNDIEKGDFSSNSFSKSQNITLRSVYRYIHFLKKKGVIQLEGSRKKGKYIITKKYLKLKQNPSNE